MAPSNGLDPSAAAISYLVHHIVLPPKLPQQDDRHVEHEKCVVELTLCALQDLQGHVKAEQVENVKSAIATIENLRDARDYYGDVSEVQLEALLAKLTTGETDGAIPLEIKAQNAGILISRCTNSLNFEFFELLPTNEAAMKMGRLIRVFPGHAAGIPVPKMSSEFRTSIARTISKATTQTAPGFQPQVRKNRKMLAENRDTTHPGLVTDFLMNVLTAVGASTDVQRINKNTREETFWKNCSQPWQRSPLWLLLRVALQLHLTRASKDLQTPDQLYKAFMLCLLSRLLHLVRNFVRQITAELWSPNIITFIEPLIADEINLQTKLHWSTLGSELLHAINAKLIRRMRKFESSGQTGCLQPNWITKIQSGVLDAHKVMDGHWQGLVKDAQANINTSVLPLLRPTSDLNMDLPELDGFIAGITSRKNITSSASFQTGSSYPEFSSAELPDCTVGSGEYKYFSLIAFEKWVEKHLQSWTNMNLHNENTCGKLRRLIENYYSKARPIYAGMPSHISIMYLTLAELWIACDRSACNIFPLLREYDPEICASELVCLVLPLKSQMLRLHAAEQYLNSRRNAAATKKQPSVYSEFGHASSFAVRYFQQSKILQSTLSQIERDATIKRQQKCDELQQLKEKYKQLMGQYNSNVCATYTVVTNSYHGYTEERHHPQCPRCAAKSNADNLKIRIYEWPVSSDSMIAQATVFELRAPQSFSNWRDISRYMITTIFAHQDSFTHKLDYCATLDMHLDLSRMLSPTYSEQRIVIASSIKAHSVTHRKHQKAIPHLRIDDVCLENALRYGYYDKALRILSTKTLRCTEQVANDCMYRIPSRSKTLEQFMRKTLTVPNGLPPNEVIASLSDCPPHFSIEEYKALAAIPLGRHILYSNILAQLANSAVDFTKVETQCFMTQIIQQAGLPDNSIERTTHSILREARIGNTIMDQLEESLQRLAQNWESWRALATFSLVARRILSLTTSLTLKSRCFKYLEKLRGVCIVWIDRLKYRASSSTDNDQRNEMYARATEIALLCTSTYDVEDADISIALHNQSAISMLLQCSITIQENHTTTKSDFQDLYNVMLQSWRSLMYRIFPTLREKVLRDRSGLCEAVTANWIAFQPAVGDFWTSLQSPQEQWLHIMSGMLPVHFNLLTAELLVNGLPLARLPSDYMDHPMYTPLFQKSTLEVVPTDEPGLKFSAKVPYHGYKLHFGMNGHHMLLVAIRDNSR